MTTELARWQTKENCQTPFLQGRKKHTARTSPLTPLRRIGKVRDVADAVVFMASDAASFITGQTLYVDGALWSQIQWPYPTKE